jgi:hypothetical protein
MGMLPVGSMGLRLRSHQGIPLVGYKCPPTRSNHYSKKKKDISMEKRYTTGEA